MHTPFETSNKAPEQKNKNNKTSFPKGRFVLPRAIEEIQKLLGGHSMEREFLIAVSYTHLTLPTNREV